MTTPPTPGETGETGETGTASPEPVSPSPTASPSPEPTSPETATEDPGPTPSPEDTATASPDSTTPEPTEAPEPTQTPQPTETPEPTTPEPATPTLDTPTTEPTTVVIVPQWPQRPSVVESTVPTGMLVVAIAVLVALLAATVALWRAHHMRTLEQLRPRDGAAVPAAAGTGTVAATADAETAVLTGITPTKTAPGTTTTEATAPGITAAGAGTPRASAPDTGATAAGPPAQSGDDDAIRLLLALGRALIDSNSPIAQVNGILHRVAGVYGLHGTEIVTFPTAIMVSAPGGQAVRTVASEAGVRTLRFDQVQAVMDLADRCAVGRIRPAEALARLEEIIASVSPIPAWQRTLGYVAVSTGLSLVLGGGWLDVLIAAVLGGAVAGLTTLTRRTSPAYQGLVVAACAFVVAVPVFLLARTGLPISPLAPLVAPLVTFLPGAQLTTGVIDLATRHMVAGAARLAAGAIQLVLLALGITSAAGLVGVPATTLASASTQALGWAGPWLGVLVYAVGVVLHYEARRASLPWIAIVLLTAYAGQVVGGVLFGAVVSAFVGALVMTPVAMFATTRRSGPAFLVAFLPGFWVLVPGALGLVGVTSAIGLSTVQAVSTIVTAGATMAAVTLGVLAGLALGTSAQKILAARPTR